ncbi:MAG TPA: hypothetical protein VG318_16600 [Actinomycetota bacterium]|nr:hypothetical protein [Actinomycetota bacterium]
MRIVRVVLATAVMASMLVVGSATPASALHCTRTYLTAVQNPPAPPAPSDVVSVVGGVITINTNVVSAYALAVTNHFASATTNYTTCQLIEGVDIARATANCVTGSAAVVNLLRNPDPTMRYVQLFGGIIQVHYATLLSDAEEIIECFVILPDIG